MKQHFELIHRTSFKSNSLLELQQFCTGLMANSPEKIFKSLDFTSLPEKSLIQLIKRDVLQMREIEVWEYVLKWGLAQNPTILSDPNIWSNDDFEKMKGTLQHCLPLIRFFSLSSKEFLQKIRPYKKLLKRQLYEDLLDSHLDPYIKPTNNISFPRIIKIDGIIVSKIINNLSIISTISRRIDKMEVEIRKFHELCNDRSYTVTFIKVKGTEEIIGGYNPLKWISSSSWGKSKDSFIFSFKNNNTNDAIISNIVDTDRALNHGLTHGPSFGNDIIVYSIDDKFADYNYNCCRKYYYEKKIRDTEDQFSIDDYEVFQITKR
ncbi:hypothetical protein RclHR1_00120028 [Rhizophagus clarus]|uniref:TLDc domain-containing protein n=1 Tax=Rhizophagus clarus TaxID=94130 RepID=A0A2Z6QL03_9GLOM|nr:hypothetical protein RclHR1_00120028 [Rhizophagus clarus]GES93506.1 hypothetical protein GLOIN_2v1881255 [Rhizophagus clarus]